MKNLTKKIILIISCFVIIILIILLLIFTVMLSKGLAIVSYIIYAINLSFYCYIIISIILMNKLKCFSKVTPFIILIFFISIIVGNFVFAINFSFYTKYKIICPFTLKDIDMKSHVEKRCEFYNKNLNSRYSYQYICSYNPIDDFKKLILDKTEYDPQNKLDLIKCVIVTNILDNNDVVFEFSEEYSDIDKYYCSTVFEPKKNNYINYNECHKEKNSIYVSALLFNSFQLIFMLIYCYFCRKLENDNNIIIDRNSGEDVIERLFSLNRMLILLRDLLNMNMANMDVSNISTERTEKNNNNEEEDLEIEKTKNIIIDNNSKYEIEVNINSLYKEKKVDDNSISLDQINFNIQSEDNLVKGNLNSSENDS